MVINRTRLFGKRLAGSVAKVRAGPVTVANAGTSLKATLNSFIKGLVCELGGTLPIPS